MTALPASIRSRHRPGDKDWLRQEARHIGLSMEEYVRRLIHEKREKTERRLKPSEVFQKHFGPARGVELPPRRQYRHKPVRFAHDGEAFVTRNTREFRNTGVPVVDPWSDRTP